MWKRAITALPKNVILWRFYLALLGTVAVESPSANKKTPIRAFFLFGGEKGIRTPGTVITVHMISNHAPSASSDISPNNGVYYNKLLRKNQEIKIINLLCICFFCDFWFLKYNILYNSPLTGLYFDVILNTLLTIKILGAHYETYYHNGDFNYNTILLDVLRIFRRDR